MKKTILSASFILSFLLAMQAQETPRVINAKINSVTVFTHGAQVNSSSEIAAPQGTSSFIVKGLSPYIDQKSIQVKGRGNFTVLSVSNQVDYISGLEEKNEIEGLRKKIEELTMKSDEIKMQIGVLREEESFLIANKSINGKQENLDPNSFRLLYEFYGTSLSKVRNDILSGERKVKDLEKEIQKLQQQLDALHSRNNLPSHSITVTIKANAASAGRLEISYLVQNAGWNPSYDIRVNNLNEPVSLVYKAAVFQNTGVDWNNVALTFSNANPNKAGNVPILNPYYLDFITYIKRDFSESPSRKSNMPSAIQEQSVAEEAIVLGYGKVAEPVGFVVSENTTSIEFRVDVPYSIPSEGQPKNIDMMNVQLPASFEYQAVPKYSRDAYLVANVHDWGQYDLLPGESNLYFENTYVGKSYLNVSSVSDTLPLSLGSDMGIVIKREKRKNFTSEKLIGNNKVVTLSWEISARNTKKEAVKIRISDQVPVSQNKDISVEIQEISGGRLNQANGIVVWDQQIKPGETKNMILTYTVKYPKEKVINLE